jgi:leukotriene-A4 hydrolase
MTDPSSLSNLHEITTTHLHLNWNISFEQKVIAGHVILDLKTLVDNVTQVILDTSYLAIQEVTMNDASLQVIPSLFAKSVLVLILFFV